MLVPLYTPGTDLNAWHRVAAPGGYEAWHFDADDVQNGLRMVAAFFDGCPFEPEYLRKYARYRRNPTRVSPPTAAEFPAVYFAIYHGEKVAMQSLSRLAAGTFSGSTETLAIQIGSNSVKIDAGGVIHLQLEQAEFTFQPRFSIPLLQRAILGSQRHQWVLPAPCCDVIGNLNALGRKFSGRGYYEHRFGTAPIGAENFAWIKGRVLLEDGTIAFQMVKENTTWKAELLEATVAGMQVIAVEAIEADGPSHPPAHIRLGNSMRFTRPREIDVTQYSRRVVYDADIQGRTATALCEMSR